MRQLSVNIEYSIMDSKVDKLEVNLHKLGLNFEIKSTGIMQRTLIIYDNNNLSDNEIISLGVLIGQTLYIN